MSTRTGHFAIRLDITSGSQAVPSLQRTSGYVTPDQEAPAVLDDCGNDNFLANPLRVWQQVRQRLGQLLV